MASPRMGQSIKPEDVQELQAHLADEFNVVVELALRLPGQHVSSVLWWVVATATPRALTKEVHRTGGAACVKFPSADVSTLAGAFFHALWDLERILSEQVRQEELARASRQRTVF